MNAPVAVPAGSLASDDPPSAYAEALATILADLGLTTGVVDEVVQPDSGVDGVVRISGPSLDETYFLQVKDRVTSESAGAVMAAPAHRQLIFVNNPIPETVAQRWRQADVHFVDGAGNAYLRSGNLLIDIRGRRAARGPAPPRTSTPTPFTASGLRVVFALLCLPSAVRSTRRELSLDTGASLGTVQATLSELERTGQLQATAHGRVLVKPRQLFDRWVEAYGLLLSNRLHLAAFDAPDPAWWKDADPSLRAEGAVWGGETAVHHLDPYLRPARAVVYATQVPKSLVVQYKLRKATGEGDVEIRDRFWRFTGDDRLAPTPLIYADLVASGEPRQMEAAARLRMNDGLLQSLDRS